MIVSVGEVSFDVDAVVFDKDGTLMDLNVAWTPAGNALVDTAAGGDPELRQRLADELGLTPDGLADGGSLATETAARITERARHVVGEFLDPVAADERIDAAMSAMAAAPVKVQPIGDVFGTIERLTNAGFVVAVASSDDSHQVFTDMAALDVTEMVAAVAGGDGPWAPKPDPGCLLALAEGLDLEPARMLMVGDSSAYVGAARAAGFAGVVGMTRADGTCPIADAVDVVVGSIDELVIP